MGGLVLGVAVEMSYLDELNVGGGGDVHHALEVDDLVGGGREGQNII